MIIRTSSRAVFGLYFMLLSRLYNESEFIAAAGVRLNSPGSEFASRMYCCLFNSAIDICADYETYYLLEYRDMWEYLERNYPISENSINRLRKNHKPGMSLFYADIGSGGDYGICEYIDSEEGSSMVRKLLARASKESRK